MYTKVFKTILQKNIFWNYIQNFSLQGNRRCCIKSFWNPLTYEEMANHFFIYFSTFLDIQCMAAESLHMSFDRCFFVFIAIFWCFSVLWLASIFYYRYDNILYPDYKWFCLEYSIYGLTPYAKLSHINQTFLFHLYQQCT